MVEYKYALLNDDLCFKYVFSHKNILEYFINVFFDYLNVDYKFATTSITAQNFIMPNNKKIKSYYGDIVAILKNEDLISLEMYKNTFNKSNYNKSYAYKCRLYANQIEKEEKDYNKLKRVIVLI